MKKIKFFLLTLLGIIIIPITNAYDLGVDISDVFYPSSWDTNSFIDYYYWLYSSNIDVRKDKPDTDHYKFRGAEDYYSLNFYIKKNYRKYVGVAYKDNGEGRDYYYWFLNSKDELVPKLFNVPNRTAFKIQMTNGKEYMIDTVYFWHNSLIFMDSKTGYTLYLNGKIKANGGVLLVDPFLEENNLYFIRFQEKKARSMTVSQSEAWEWFVGKKDGTELKKLKFTTSYEVREGGNSFFPVGFHVYNDKQGGLGYTYQEDLEFVDPKWDAGGTGGNGNAGNNSGDVAEAYRACMNYYAEVHNLARLGDKCSGNGQDGEAMENFLTIKRWNGEGDIPQLTGKSAFICGVFGKYKKQYKEEYKDNWEKFEGEWEKYMFDPDGLRPRDKCEYIKDQGANGKISAFSASGLELLSKSLGEIGKNLGNKLDCGNGVQVSQTLFEKKLGTYIAYYTACRDKTFLPTKYDSWKSYFAFTFFGSNNENVCKYASELKQEFLAKYGNCEFHSSYRNAVASDLSGNVFNSDGKLDGKALENVVKGLPGNPFDDQGGAGIFSFLKDDYKEGVDTAYSLLSKIECGAGFGVKERDYIVYFPLFLLLIVFIKGKL